MASQQHTRPRPRPGEREPGSGASFDRQLRKILEHATAVFCAKGYEGASMRDIARSTGMSLAGMYHYFGTKERLLYLIQKHTFTTILSRLRSQIENIDHAEMALRAFILNHLQYSLDHQDAMKVLSHEDEALAGDYGREIAEIKRQYYRICRDLLHRYKKENRLQFDSRTALLALFGMMNWIYTWYNPRLDGGPERLAKEMGDIFFRGIANAKMLRRGQSYRSGRRAALPHAAHRTETVLSLA